MFEMLIRQLHEERNTCNKSFRSHLMNLLGTKIFCKTFTFHGRCENMRFDVWKLSTFLNPQGLEYDSLCLRTSFFVARLQDVQNIRCVAQQDVCKHIDNVERYPTIFILISINGDK